jgi:CheY-like chemotaxis protein
MNILLVEDRGAVAYYLRDALEGAGHQVFLAPNISRAKEYWDKGGIDCIVLDLNMSPDGLTEAEVRDTLGGVLTGWIWLKNYVLAKDSSMKSRTIILTAYLPRLKEKLRAEGSEGLLDQLIVMPKHRSGQADGGDIMAYITRISMTLQGGG